MGRNSAAVNLIFGLAPLTAGVVAVVIISSGRAAVLWFSLALVTVGFLFLAMAKIPALRKGRLVTFGPCADSPIHRALWWLSVAFVSAGVFVGLLAQLGERPGG